MKLKPVRHQIGKRVYWRVRLGKRLTGKAKVEQRYFDSRSAATEYIEKALAAKRSNGEAAFQLTTTQQADAVASLALLHPLKVNLLEAAQFFVAASPKARSTPTLAEHVKSYIAARNKSCTKHTLATYRSNLKHASAEFGKLHLSEISQTALEEWSDELTLAPRSICNALDTLTMVFNDAVRKNHIDRNPAEHVPRPTLETLVPGILTPSQARRLLLKAAAARPVLIPAIAAALFAGIRRSELCGLTPANLLFDDGLIEIPSSVAKTRQRRLVKIRPNLMLWLKTYFDPSLTRLAATHHPDVFGQWLRDLAIAAKIVPWPHNAMRHSFASYYFAKCENEYKVAAQMGNSPNMVFQNYRAVVRPAQAREYFSINPPKV